MARFLFKFGSLFCRNASKAEGLHLTKTALYRGSGANLVPRLSLFFLVVEKETLVKLVWSG